MSRCKSCGAEIKWIRTRAGKRMPLDAIPSRGGNVRLTENGTGDVLSGDQLADARRVSVMYVSHFATCPKAAAHRKGERA